MPVVKKVIKGPITDVELIANPEINSGLLLTLMSKYYPENHVYLKQSQMKVLLKFLLKHTK